MTAVLIMLPLVAGAALVYLFRKEDPKLSPRTKAGYKVVPTLLCAALALYGAAGAGRPGYWLLMLGLCVCAAADWLLEFAFFRGMAAFGCGHILYCAGYLLTVDVTWRSLAVFLVLAAAVLFLYSRLKSRLDRAPLYLAYACLLCAMAALAASGRAFLLAGGLLFVISDCMIGIGVATSRRSRAYDTVILVTYYAAQFLIASAAVLA